MSSRHLSRQHVERKLAKALAEHGEVRILLRQGGFTGVRKYTQLLHGCLEVLNTEAGLPEPEAALVTSTVLQSSFPSMLLFRDGDVRAASRAVSTLWIAYSSGEPPQLAGDLHRALARGDEQSEKADLAEMFPMAVFEETAAARKESSGRRTLRRLMTSFDLSFDDVGRMLEVSGETVRRWERGVSRIPSVTLATLDVAEVALRRLTALFLPQRLPEVVRRKADLFDGSRALDWILRARISDVVDRYEQALSYQG